ncbi:hypothetical protein [Vallitalea maricola]|uniref:Uncharacterized protein n=1 Tax=Vallitalea maricola TaxID=3074433 RepID=A0ACB5UHC6_9FIRM|nr:hypothetical protein AN2V17_11740 [Vallitalea sp. AN17-2]
MKLKKIITFTILLSLVSILAAPVYAENSPIGDKYIKRGEYYIVKPVTDTRADIYLGPKYPESSQSGYEKYTDSQGNKYLYRIRHIKLVQMDYGDVTHAKIVETVPRGHTKTTEKTVTVQKSFSYTWSIGGSHTQTLNALEGQLSRTLTVNYSQTYNTIHTYTITEGTKYTFPSEAPLKYNVAYFWAGFIHDKYETCADVVEYKRFKNKTKVLSYQFKRDPRDPKLDQVIFKLEDGRTKKILARHFDRYYENGYFIEYRWGYDYDNKITVYGELLSPKGTEFVRYSEL